MFYFIDTAQLQKDLDDSILFEMLRDWLIDTPPAKFTDCSNCTRCICQNRKDYVDVKNLYLIIEQSITILRT